MLISVPAISLLFLQNKQVQTSISSYLTEKLAHDMGTRITLSAVRYNFFKRLHVYDLLIEDEHGDTLIYSEVTTLRFKKFKPEKQDIHIRKITTENSYLNLEVDKPLHNNMQFFIDYFKKDLLPEEKAVVRIDRIETEGSTFKYVNYKKIPYKGGIDFSDLLVTGLNARVDDLMFRRDTTTMKVVSGNATEKSGFHFDDLAFDLSVGKQFLRFSDGLVISDQTIARVPLVSFEFDDYVDFEQVYDLVDIKIQSEGSRLDMDAVYYFFPQLDPLAGTILLSGSLTGRLGDMVGSDIRVNYGTRSFLDMNMRLVNIQDIPNLQMTLNVKHFQTTLDDFKVLTIGLPLGPLHDSIFGNKAGLIKYSGNFDGTLRKFQTDGILLSKLGELRFDLGMQPDTTGRLTYDGFLEANKFKAGTILDIPETVGDISLALHLNGEVVNQQFNTSVDGSIESLGFYGYNYSNILINGQLSNRTYTGSFEIKDPNIDLSFDGIVDFEQELPRMNFNVQVANLRPYYLGLRDDDPEYFASFFLKTNLEGIRLDNMNGEVRLVNSLFRKTGQQIQIYDLLLEARNHEDSTSLNLRSDLVDADISGKFKLSSLPATFKGILQKSFNLFPEDSMVGPGNQSFTYRVDFKQSNTFLNFFIPSFHLADHSRFYGEYHSSGASAGLRFEGMFPSFEYNGNTLFNLLAKSVSDSNSMNFDIEADSLSIAGKYTLASPVLDLHLSNNRSDATLAWENTGSPKYAGRLETEGILTGTQNDSLHYSMEIKPSTAILNNRKFDIRRSKLAFIPGGIDVDSLQIIGMDQYISADGKYRVKDEAAEIRIMLANINLSGLTEIIANKNVALSGRATGEASLKSQYKKPIFTANLVVDSLGLNDVSLGKTSLYANWFEPTNSLDIKLESASGRNKPLSVQGSYQPGSGNLDFDIAIKRLPVRVVQPYLNGKIDQVAGTADFELNLDGTIHRPMLNGNVYFDNTSFLVHDTKTSYSFSDNLRIYNSDLFFENLEVRDGYGNIMSLNGNILHENFRDFSLNLRMNARNFNFLQTSKSDNEQFYGNVFASGQIQITGPPNKIHVAADVRTERNTDLKLPLYNAETVKRKDFITFINTPENSEEKEPGQATGKGDFTLDMDLQITSNATVQLIFDPNVGDIIEASGDGDLKLEMDDQGDLNVYGVVSIVEGDYLFTLQNVINKRFQVKPGGKITWNGAPSDATIDLQAIYELKAATYNLSPAPTESMKKRIPVYCELILEGDLQNPLIKPGIELPTAEPETRTLLQNTTGTDEELMKQFISLLVLNNFLSPGGIGGAVTGGINSGGVAGVTASELLSNQLSNWLSQISNDFDIGVNYRPGDEISSDEVEVALSTQLMDDRIIISGNVDVGGNQVNPAGDAASNIVGDFDLEFKVTDKISVKAFNRANDDFILRTAPYTQGVGVFYRSEFNSVSDLFGKEKKKQKKRRKEKEEQNGDAILKEEQD